MSKSDIVKKITESLDPDNNPDAGLKPYYECNNTGVYYIGVEAHGKDYKPEIRLSDCINLIGRGADEAGNHYRVIQWQDRISSQRHISALAMADIGSNWAYLQGLGIAIKAGRVARERLADYLQTEGAETAYTIVNRAGWHNDSKAYILPSGEILGDASNVIYNGDTSQSRHYQPSGELSDWQDNIARYCVGNSRSCLALGTAFAAPLMRLLGIEGGGFHLFGDSSDGKTTNAKIALSVWGDPDSLALSWEGTAHGFSNTASAKNDGLLLLDEIGQATPRVVAQTAYSVINGTGKVQGHKDGGNREINRWRVLVLSTGEKTLQGYLHTIKQPLNAGQAARLPSINADAGQGFGAYDCVHGFDGGAELSEHFSQQYRRYHGTAGRAFMDCLIKDKDQAIKQVQASMKAFLSQLPNTSGQARRVANRFALVAGALELAKFYNIVPIEGASASIKQCFDDWLASAGVGKYEDRQILTQATDFMQANASSARFVSWSASQSWGDHAGYRKDSTQGDKAEYWIIKPVFRDEIAQGFEVNKTCKVLHDAGWLLRNDKGKRWQHKRWQDGWYYVLIGKVPPDGDDTAG